MRNFWILIGLLAIAAGAWVALGGGKDDNGRNVADLPRAASDASDNLTPPVTAARPDPAASAPVAPGAATEPVPEATKVAEAPQPATAAEPEPQPAAPAATTAVAEDQVAPGDVETKTSPGESEQPEATLTAAPAPEAEPVADVAAAEANESETEEKPAPAPAASLKAEIERQPDGSMLVDKRFIVKGTGTPQDPYQVTWDMLVSAGEVYQPREGRTELPERITMLAGKHVQITGNVAFPLMAQEANELLAMLNQWDGCCIGVPPTPYDAIEVRLKDAAEGSDRFTTFGTVSGRLDVKPHLVGNWLVGLYVMDDATLKPGAYDGFGS